MALRLQSTLTMSLANNKQLHKVGVIKILYGIKYAYYPSITLLQRSPDTLLDKGFIGITLVYLLFVFQMLKTLY